MLLAYNTLHKRLRNNNLLHRDVTILVLVVCTSRVLYRRNITVSNEREDHLWLELMYSIYGAELSTLLETFFSMTQKEQCSTVQFSNANSTTTLL